MRDENRARRVRGRKVAPPAVTVATERSVPPEESATTTAGTGQNVTLPPPPPQQTRARTPTPPESLERITAKKARQGDGSSDSEGDYSSDQPEPTDAEESTDRERDSLQHTSSQPHGPQSAGKKKVTTCTGTVHVRRHSTPEEEELASWWEQETYLYNRALLDYKDTKKKDAAIAAKGRLMNRTGNCPAPIFLTAPAAYPGFFYCTE